MSTACRSIVAVVLTSLACAQRPEPVDLPRLMRIGTVPEAAAVMILTSDGRLARPSGQEAGPKTVLLRIDRKAPLASVTKLLDTLRAAGTEQVLFAAMLPDGNEGCFVLALPAADEPRIDVGVRLHRQRAGVPAASVVPVLRRMQLGLDEPPLVVAVEAPDDAPFEPVLQVIEAVREAGITTAVLRSSGGKGGNRLAEVDGGLGALAQALGHEAATAAGSAFAIDLGPAPLVAVSAQAIPRDRPTVGKGAIGCFGRAVAAEPRVPDGGGAGGRYGGRGGAAPKGTKATADRIAAAAAWFDAQQAPDGSFAGDDGRPDLAATALVMLTALGQGSSLRGGSQMPLLRRGIGWILDQQRDDGGFVANGPDSTRDHALATYALAEAYGLSNAQLVRGSLRDALRWLDRRRNPDGGYRPHAELAASDCASTCHAMMALASAGFFGIELAATPADVVGWFDAFDREAEPTNTENAAALFARFFAGQDPKRQPTMWEVAKKLVATADPGDPWCAYWTTYGLFQCGGREWTEWQRRLEGVLEQQSDSAESGGAWSATERTSTVATTALYVLSAQAYYRYTRLVR